MAPVVRSGDHQLELRVMPMPAEVNSNGDVVGGRVGAQPDITGAVLPYRIAKGRTATVALKQFEAGLACAAIDKDVKPRPLPRK